MSKLNVQITNERRVIPEAYGSRYGAQMIITPKLEGRIWPEWSVRYHMSDYPLMAQRFDYGGDLTEEMKPEFQDFLHTKHKNVSRGVYVMTVEKDGMLIHPSIISLHEGRGFVSRWLDKISFDEQVHAFTEVVVPKMAEMLFRRGYEVMCMCDDDQPDEMWLPVHIQATRFE